MFHGTLTLLTRSLRLEALQLRAHMSRIVSIGIVFLLLLATHIYTAGRGSPGLRFFSLICHLCLGLITIAGAGHFSTAVTEEKEAGTLNLLILANVPAVAILVGKSTTRIVSVLLLFVGIFPFALLALALGGATAHQVWSGLLALAAYTVLVANIGLLASVVRRNGSGAAVITTGILVALLAGPYALARTSKALIAAAWSTAGSPLVTGIDEFQKVLDDHSILTRLQRIQTTGFAASAWSGQVCWSLAIGALLFGVSWILFRRFCEYLPDPAPPRSGVLKIKSGSRPSLGRRLLTPRPWHNNPLAWKDFHFLVGGVPGLLLRAAIIPLIASGLFAVDQLLSAGMHLTAPDALRLALLIAAALEVVALSARIFNSEYRGNTLCTLALLPRSTISLCYSKVAGCALVLLPFVFWFFAVGARYATNLDSLAGIYLIDPPTIILFCLVIVLAHLTAWMSLHVKWGALPLSLMLLLILTSCVSPFVAVVAATTSRSEKLSYPGTYPVIYMALLVSAALQIGIALRFRRAAAE